jgi:hypothetical protein
VSTPHASTLILIGMSTLGMAHHSNDDIQPSFIERKYHQVGLYVDGNLMKTDARCHVYSLPFLFNMFYNLANSFQGGMFEKFQWLVVMDTRTFEHEFFKMISQSFAFLRILSVRNYTY